MRIIEDHNALEATEERLFPASKHRSARIRKKLIKRFGSEFRMRPCAFIVNGDTLFVHPALMLAANLRQHVDQAHAPSRPFDLGPIFTAPTIPKIPVAAWWGWGPVLRGGSIISETPCA